MVKRVIRKPIRNIVVIGLVLMAVLLVLGVSVQHKVHQQAEKRANDMAERVALNNATIIKTKLEGYHRVLVLLEILQSDSQLGGDLFGSMIDSLAASDSSIVFVWTRGDGRVESASSQEAQRFLTNLPRTQGKPVQVSYAVDGKTRHSLLRIWRNTATTKGLLQVGVVIDLVALHGEMMNIREMQSAYVTIVNADRLTFYHPDEQLIGLRDREFADSLSLAGALDTGWIEKSANSSYLGIKVYRHSYPFAIGTEKLLITVSVPNLDFAEFMSKTQRNLWLLVVLPMVLFIVYIVIGIVVWMREFVKHKEMEKDVLKLQLQAEQQNKQMVTSELENLKSGINPHYLFNSLGSLVALIKRNPDQAVTFTRSLSSQYRYLLEMEQRNVVPIAEEMEFTRHYIHIQSIRFGEAIRFAADVPLVDRQGVPPLAIQTLVENCIKHNMASVAHPLAIDISVANGFITVSNNLNRRTGVVESTGKGLANLVKRYSYLTTQECRFVVEDGRFSASIPILEI